MVPFSLAFLLPVTAAHVFGRAAVALAPAAPLAPVLVVCACRRWRPHLVPVLAGGLLAALRLPDALPEESRVPRRGVPLPVSVEGTVSGPATPLGTRRTLVPLGGLPPLMIPAGARVPLPGTRVRATGRLEPLAREVSVTAPAAITVVAPPPPLHPPALLARLRATLRERLTTGLGPRAATHLEALLLGVRRLPREDHERLARTGTLHLLAVSGLHVAVFLGILRRGLGRRPLLLASALLLYAGLTGFRSPVARAYLLAALSLVGARIGRRERPLSHLLLCMTSILAWDPAALAGAGFLLSFGSYAGIRLLAVPRITGDAEVLARRLAMTRARRAALGLRTALLVSTAAFLGSLPLTVTLFHRVSWIAVPGSVLLAPLVPLLLAAGAVLMIAPGLPPVTALAELAVGGLALLVDVLDAVPYGHLDVAAPRAAGVLGAVAGLLWLVRLASVPRPRRRSVLAATVLLGGLLLARPPEPGLVLLRAGRGLAALAVGREGVVLVDCGPASARVERQLLARGAASLDALLLSHLDEDHAGGLPALCRRVRVRRLLGGPAVRTSGPPVPAPETVLAGDSRAVGDVAVRVLWPPEESGFRSRNDNSLVLLVEVEGLRALLLGDLGSRPLEAVLERADPGPVDVLVVPHHGARNAALADALLRARPRRAWIPARAGFPDEGTLLTLGWAGVPVRSTWRDGALELRPPPRGGR